MSPTRIRRFGLVAFPVFAFCLAISPCSEARQLIVPNVGVWSVGVGGVLWGTELRMTNLTAEAQTVAVTDWIGSPGWLPGSFVIPANGAISVGGWQVWNSEALLGPVETRHAIFGAAVLDIPDGVMLQSRVLAGVYRPSYGGPGGMPQCPGWLGGYHYGAAGEDCNHGSGPVADPIDRFFNPDEQAALYWLDSEPDWRVNLNLINAEAVDATVEVTITGADGSVTRTAQYTVPARSVVQINNLFSHDPWTDIRTDNHAKNATAARGTVTATQRFFAAAYLISNDNQTMGICFPKIVSP